jgi:hypothetical protein
MDYYKHISGQIEQVRLFIKINDYKFSKNLFENTGIKYEYFIKNYFDKKIVKKFTTIEIILSIGTENIDHLMRFHKIHQLKKKLKS